MTRRSLLLVVAILSLSLTGLAPNAVRAVAPALPDKLADRDYWNLVTELSEPDGEFRSDNLLSNEIFLQYVIPELVRSDEEQSRLPRRRSRAELHLHRRPQAEDGVHRRHPARQSPVAPDVQGALRVVLRQGRLHLQVVFEKAPRGARTQIDRGRDLRGRAQGGPGCRGGRPCSSGRTSRACRII